MNDFLQSVYEVALLVLWIIVGLAVTYLGWKILVALNPPEELVADQIFEAASFLKIQYLDMVERLIQYLTTKG